MTTEKEIDRRYLLLKLIVLQGIIMFFGGAFDVLLYALGLLINTPVFIIGLILLFTKFKKIGFLLYFLNAVFFSIYLTRFIGFHFLFFENTSIILFCLHTTIYIISLCSIIVSAKILIDGQGWDMKFGMWLIKSFVFLLPLFSILLFADKDYVVNNELNFDFKENGMADIIIGELDCRYIEEDKDPVVLHCKSELIQQTVLSIAERNEKGRFKMRFAEIRANYTFNHLNSITIVSFPKKYDKVEPVNLNFSTKEISGDLKNIRKHIMIEEMHRGMVFTVL